MEDDLNKRRPQWKTTSMEGDFDGRQPQWKKTSMEDYINGRQPQWKMTTIASPERQFFSELGPAQPQLVKPTIIGHYERELILNFSKHPQFK